MYRRVHRLRPKPGPYFLQSIPLRHRSSTAHEKEKLLLNYEKLEKFTNRILKAATKRDNGWYHERSRSGEEARLMEVLRTSQKRTRIPSREKPEFFAASAIDKISLDDFHDAATSHITVEPGSFVEVRRNYVVTHGVVLGSSVFHNISSVNSLITSGEVWPHRPTDIMFAIPGFINPDLISRCGNEEVATNSSMTAARLQVLKRARDFERAVEAAYNAVGRTIPRLYPRVKSPHPEEWTKISTMDATRILDVRPNVPVLTLLAVHKHLMRRSSEFIAHPLAHKQTHMFDVRPQAHIDNLETVTNWVRENNPALSAFTSKARTIIDITRSLHDASFFEPPSQANDIIAPPFSPDDLTIIQFLQHSLRSQRTTQIDPYASIVPSIIKMVARYGGDVESDVIQRLLCEIGVYTPWEDMASKDRDLNLDQGPIEERAKEKAGEVYALKARFASTAHTAEPLGEADFYPRDPLESVRHDFGSMPVYVIDDIGAEELDDGISFEAIPNEPESAWIHVHIADPTSLLPPGHSISKQARKQMSTAYFVHRTSPMLPTSFTSHGMSLGISPDMEQEGKGQNVLTFSFKIDATGSLSDYKVRAGFVRKVYRMLYDDVNVFCGDASSEEFKTLPFETSNTQKPVSPIRDVSHLIPHRENLLAMRAVTQRILKRLRQLPIFSYSQPKSEITITSPLPIDPIEPSSPTLYRGFPQLRYAVVDQMADDTGSRAMVAEFMKIASRVASRFCLDNGLPAIHRTMGPMQASKVGGFEKLLALRNDSNYVDALEVLKVGIRVSDARYTLQRLGHWALAIPVGEGYMRVTSPLRRYVDMVGHWQIKHALLPPSKRGAAPPFSEAQLQTLITEMTQHDRIARKAKSLNERYWSHMFIARFMETQKRRGHDAMGHDPLQSMDAFTVAVEALDLRHKQYHVDVYLPVLGLVANMELKSHGSLDIGTHCKVRVKEVRLGLNPRILVEQIL